MSRAEREATADLFCGGSARTAGYRHRTPIWIRQGYRQQVTVLHQCKMLAGGQDG